MKQAPFGSTGVSISRIGIGGWQAGGTGPWGGGPKADDDLSVAAIRFAVEAGVTWVETAASYGLGHSEQIVARALQPWEVGEEVFVFTKIAHPWDEPLGLRTELKPATIRRQCEESLDRLGVERIDLLQFHHADPEVPVEESWGTMTELVAEGKVRWAGVSNFAVDLLDRCERIMHVDSIQPELSLLRAGAREDVIPWAAAHGSAVICYSPLATGLLAGPPTAERLAAAAAADAESGAERLRLVSEALTRLAAELKTTRIAMAVAWVLATPGVTAAICGARSPSQVEGWIDAAEVDLGPALGEIEAVLSSMTNGP